MAGRSSFNYVIRFFLMKPIFIQIVSQILWIATFFVQGIYTLNKVPHAECLEDFSPCTCFPFETGVINVDCNQIPYAEVKAAFDLTTTTNKIRFFMTLPNNTTSIPANLLGSNKAKEISLTCLNRNFEVQINIDAFLNSQSFGISFMIEGCSLNQLSLAFLSNFAVLNELTITNSTFPDMSTLPVLPSLYTLIVSNCQGFKTWGNPSLGSVHELYLNSNLLGDTVVSGILSNILASSNSLESLYLRTNLLTKVPDAIRSFTTLSVLDLNDNEIPVLTNSSLTFSASEVKYIRLEGVSLNTIQAGAFQGDEYIFIYFLNPCVKLIFIKKDILARLRFYSRPTT